MPHQIATTNGKSAIAYFGDVPWHQLGTRLDEPATAAEAIAAAGLDYQVELKKIVTESGTEISNRKAVVRADSAQVLGVVGNSYQPIQNHQCFGFLDAIVADGRLRYHTVGALGQGERVWMLAKVPGDIRIKDSDDVTEKFLLLSNSHDGTSALRIFFTPIRVVCANTLAMAERRGYGRGVSVAHKGNLAAKVSEAQQVLGFAQRYYDDLADRIERLANIYPNRRQLKDYFEEVFPDPLKGSNRRALNVRGSLTRLFEEGRGQQIPEIRYSAWAAFNAVTEYVDHHRSTRGSDPYARADRRLQSAWFGSGARLKRQGWRLIQEVARN